MNRGMGVAFSMFIAAGLVASLASGQEEPPEAPSTEVRYVSRQSMGKGVVMAQLSNGMTVLVRENHAAPVATVRSYVRNTGSVYEGKYLGAGISHLCEHLVAGGSTSKRDEDDIQALIDTLGGSSNAYTSNDITAYFIDSPAKQVSLAVELVADMMQFAAFKDDEFQRELGVVQRELEMGESERSRVLYAAMKQLVFTEHPMRHPIIGYLPVLQKITRQDCIDFYQSRYVPQNMVFVVAGDVQTDAVLEDVRKNFADFQRTTERGPVLPIEPDQASPRSTRIEMEGATTLLSLAWPTVPLQHPDLYPLDVISYLLTNGDSSRLVKRLQVDQPLAIEVDSSSYTPGFVKGWLDLSIECQPDDVEACRKILIEEIHRLQREPVSAQELAKVMRQKSADHIFAQQTVQAQAEAVARSFLGAGDPLFDEQYVQGIKTVTPASIQAAAQKYLRPERVCTVAIVPTGSKADSLDDAGDGDLESPIVRKKLSNGLTVLIKRHAVLPMVSVQAFVRGGVLTDDAQTSGRASLTAEVMDLGTEKYTAEQIAEYFDNIGGSLGVGSQRNTSYVQASILREDFETSLDYVHQVLFKPTFPDDEFVKARQLQLGQIAAREANPQTQILDFWTTLLPASTPYSRTVQGSAATVEKLTAADCRAFHKQYFVPNNMVLAVFGDVNVEDTLALLEKTFGQEPAAPKFKFPTFTAPTALESDVNKNLASRRPDTAMVVLGYAIPPIDDEKTQSALEILNSMLTDSGGRMFNELRGEKLVYYVFGFPMAGPAPGYFLFMAQTQPNTRDEVLSRIRANLDRVRKEGVTDDELAKIKQKLLASHAMENTTASSQAFQAALFELYGLGYDYERKYDARISAVTSAEIQAVLDRYFRSSYIATGSPETPAK